MAETEAGGRAPRPPAERLGEDDRLGLPGAAEARRARVDAVALGGAEAGAPAGDFPMRVVLERLGRHGDLYAPVLEEARALGAAAKKLARLDP
jgi:hypothetical protein